MPVARARTAILAIGPSSAGRRHGETAGSGNDVAALTLDDRGMIWHCNREGEALFQYRRSELVWRHVSLLLPQLAELSLVLHGEPNPHLRYLCHLGRHFQAVPHDGKTFPAELFLTLLDNTGRGRLSLVVRPAQAVSQAG